MTARAAAAASAKKVQPEKLLKARQAAFLYIAVVTVYKMINLPSVLVARAGRDGWLASVVLMAWELVILIAFVALTVCCPKKTLEDLLGRVAGKVITRILFALFGLFLLFRLYLGIVTTEQFLFINLYDRGNWLTVALPVVVVLGYGASKGIRAIGRAAELTGTVLAGVLAVGIIAMLTQADFHLLAPVMHDGGEPLFRAVESTLLGAGEGIVFLLLLGRVERFHLVRHMTAAFSVASFFVVGFNLCYYGYYGDTAVHLKYGAAIRDMLQYMRGADTLARADLLVILAVLVLFLFQLLTYAWGVTVCTRRVFGLPDSHSARMWAFSPSAVVLLLFDLFLQSRIFQVYGALDAGWSFAVFVPFQVILPILIVIGAAVSRRKTKTAAVFRAKGLRYKGEGKRL